MKHAREVIPFVLLAVASAGACGKKAQPQSPTPASEAQQPQVPQRVSADEGESRAEAEARLRAEAERNRRVLQTPVYFDYDDARIRSDAQASLDAKVPPLRSLPDLRLRIEGHADERGSVEYNLALGMRRAESVRQYLIGFGVSDSRLEITTAGEDKPADSGHNEAAWARNRRAEFEILGGLPVVGVR